MHSTSNLKYVIADEDDCDPNPCQNGGSCIDAVGSYKCVCEDGYTGDNCQTGMCWVDMGDYAFNGLVFHSYESRLFVLNCIRKSIQLLSCAIRYPSKAEL